MFAMFFPHLQLKTAIRSIILSQSSFESNVATDHDSSGEIKFMRWGMRSFAMEHGYPYTEPAGFQPFRPNEQVRLIGEDL